MSGLPKKKPGGVRRTIELVEDCCDKYWFKFHGPAWHPGVTSVRLCAIKTQKQISHGVPHSQREQAPPPVLFTVVKHMATLAKGLQISQPVIGGIMVKVRGRQR